MTSRRWFHGFALGLLLVAALVLFWSAIMRGETFALRDLRSYYHAAKAIVAPLARASGGLPLWNPLFASGQPFAENPEHELFHPLTWLLFVLPFEAAFRCQVILPILGATGAMYALLRTLARSGPAALFGALTWGLGGYLLSTTTLLPILFAASALPLVLLFAIRVARGDSTTDIAGLAVAFALVCLAGEPTTILATPPLVAAAIASERRRVDGRRGVALAGGLLLGTALAAVVLLPGVHHAAQTVRARGLPAGIAGQWSLPPVRLLELLSPYVVGHSVGGAHDVYWGGPLYPGKQLPFLYSIYPGLLATLLAAAGCIARPRAHAAWLAVAAVGAALAFGPATPIWTLARHLPGMSGLRYPEKFALLVLLPLAVVAARGFDQVTRGAAASRRPLLIALGVLGALGLLIAGGLLVAGGSWMTRASARDALRLTLVAVACMAVLACWRRLGRVRGSAALCVVAVADLVAAGRPLVGTLPVSELADPPPVMRALVTSGRDELLFHQAAWQLATGGTSQYLAQPPIPAQWGVALTLEDDFDLTQLAWSSRSTELFWRAVNRDPALVEPLLDRRGVTAILKVLQGTRSNVGLFQARSARPFAFAARRVEIVEGDAGWLDGVVRLGADARDAALVPREELPAFAAAPPPAEVAIAARAPGSVALEVSAAGPGPSFVAINQTWHPGWRATVDERPARVLRSDVALSGLVVPPGRHRVVLEYHAPWLDAGMAISAAAALACGALVLVGRRRRG